MVDSPRDYPGNSRQPAKGSYTRRTSSSPTGAKRQIPLKAVKMDQNGPKPVQKPPKGIPSIRRIPPRTTKKHSKTMENHEKPWKSIKTRYISRSKTDQHLSKPCPEPDPQSRGLAPIPPETGPELAQTLKNHENHGNPRFQKPYLP